MNSTCLFQTAGNIYHCWWNITKYGASSDLSGHCLCLFLSKADAVAEQDDRSSLPVAALEKQSPVTQFIESALVEEPSSALISLCFVLSSQNGYVARSDFISQRLEGSERVRKVAGFLLPRQMIEQVVQKTQPDDGQQSPLTQLLAQSIAGILLPPCPTLTQARELSSHFTNDLANRLSFPWTVPTLIPPKRLAWVEGRKNVEVSRRMYTASAALGISLIIIDNPGHWLQDNQSEHAHLREAFIPTNITVDVGFTERIVQAVRGYNGRIDGLMTVSDSRLAGVARACKVLGFATSPSMAFDIAGDKALTREVASRGEEGNAAYLAVSDLEELDRVIAAGGLPNGLVYPLVVKPSMGWGSDCVSKVDSRAELLLAAEKASRRHASSVPGQTGFVIERYVSGPEFDANIVLCNGKIIFAEVADDFPSCGDDAEATYLDNFQETANLLPTGLPEDEVELILDSVRRYSKEMGFMDGVFHCEGRVEHSAMQYGYDENGLQNLIPSTLTTSMAPRNKAIYLHEINARPPGYLESVATMLTYGVDYYALQQLFAVGDMQRYRNLSSPFKQGAQWHLSLLLIPEPSCGGIMATPDTVLELLDKHPHLAAAIADYNTVVKMGHRLMGPASSELSYLAYISVISRQGREKCLRLAEEVRQSFSYEFSYTDSRMI